MKKIIIRISINTVLGFILIYAWTRFVNVEEVWTKLSTANPLLIVGVGGCLLISTFLRGLRFKVLLSDTKISLSQVSFLTYFSQLLSFVIPLRLGEFVKGIYISNQSKQSVTSAILWVFVDRLVDFWVVLSLLGLLLLVVPTSVPQNISLIVAAIVLALSLGIAITVYYPKLIKYIVAQASLIIFIKRLRTVLTGFAYKVIDSFSILRINPSRQLLLVGLTTFSWIFEALAWYIVLMGLGVTDMNFITIMLGAMLMALSFILPSAPGYLGSLQAAGVVVFSIWLGIDPVVVSAATVIMHLSIIIYVLIMGITSLYFLKLDLGDLLRKFKTKQD